MMGVFGILFQMSIQKKRKSGALSLLEIIHQHQQLRQYFQKHSKPQNYASLAVELLKESIKTRTSDPSSRPKDKHYHVAYIKHNRFLSPSQKQEVTEKITQILPVNQKPVRIYAKPKPKDDEGSNYERCIEEVWEGQAEKEGINSLRQKCVGRDDESQKYLSPKVDRKAKEDIRPIKDKPRVNPYNSPKQRQPNPQQNKLIIESHCKSTIKQSKPDAPVFSPRVKQNYDKVQSRIKFLIQRDKQNKKVEKLLQKQNKKIEKLEERQERLLLLQYEQERELSRNNKIQQYMKEKLSDSEESDSLDLRQPSQKQNDFQHRLDHIDSRAKYFQSKHSALPSNLSIPKDKTYKLNSEPIYALTSSSSSDLNDYQ